MLLMLSLLLMIMLVVMPMMARTTTATFGCCDGPKANVGDGPKAVDEDDEEDKRAEVGTTLRGVRA